MYISLFRSASGLYISIVIFIATTLLRQVHGVRRGREEGEKSLYIPRFRPTPQNITVGPGDRAVLKCRVENLGTKTVSWHRTDKQQPLTIGLFIFAPDNRISVHYNQSTNEWSLVIQDIKPEDEGIYQCLISSKDLDKKTYDINLNVTTVQVSGSPIVERGSAVHLICNATGKPDPPHDVEWYRDGLKIHSDADSGILITKKIETRVLISVLVIKQSKMTDAGDYVCRSTNRDTGTIKVLILRATSPPDILTTETTETTETQTDCQDEDDCLCCSTNSFQPVPAPNVKRGQAKFYISTSAETIITGKGRSQHNRSEILFVNIFCILLTILTTTAWRKSV